jgi:hypothetical protein
VADDLKPSAGQLALLPVQLSAMSHGPADARQTVAVDWKLSAGQLALLPVQFSTASHGPADPRQTVAADASASLGQSRLVPVQVSATSQVPVEARHIVPAFPGALSQNFTPPVPVAHVSTVQRLWSSQSAFELQFGGAITQSDGSEFGCWDGYEHTSISSPPAPTSVVVRQQFTTASSATQLLPLHLFAVCDAVLTKGSSPVPTLTPHSDVQATGCELVHRVGLSLAQV